MAGQSRELKILTVPEDVYGHFSLYSKFGSPNLLELVSGKDTQMIVFPLTRDSRTVYTAAICPPEATQKCLVHIFSDYSAIEFPIPFPLLWIYDNGILSTKSGRKEAKIIPLDAFGNKVRKDKFVEPSSLTDPLKINLDQTQLNFYIFILFSELANDKWQLGRMVQTKDFDQTQPHPLTNAIYQALKS